MTVRDLPDVVRAYWYLIGAGWRLFVAEHIVKRPVEKWLAPRQQELPGGKVLDDAQVKRAARWTNTAARYPFPWARCLQRSLAMSYWLERKGAHPALRLGVGLDNGALVFHAWVEYGGQVVNDTTARTGNFKAFPPNTYLSKLKFKP